MQTNTIWEMQNELTEKRGKDNDEGFFLGKMQKQIKVHEQTESI